MLLYIVGFAFILMFLYPYILYPVILKLFAKKPYSVEVGIDIQHIKTAFLFCAFNEEKSLPEKIRNIREILEVVPELEVLAYSDGSSDSTNQILLDASDILRVIISKERTGKVMGMKQLVSMTNADVLICSDANVFCEPDGIKRLIEYFTLPEIGAVASTLLYREPGESRVTATAKVGRLYWKLEEFMKRLESATGSMMGADGSLYAVRTEYYPDLPGHLVDDMASSLATVFHGLRCVSVSDVIAYEYAIESSQEEYIRKKRIACGSYSTYLHFRSNIARLSWMNRFKFYSHKVMRWWGGLYLFYAVLCFLLGGFYTGYFLTISSMLFSMAFLILFAGGIGLPGFSTAYEIIKAIAATLIGVLEALLGRKYEVWNGMKSR